MSTFYRVVFIFSVFCSLSACEERHVKPYARVPQLGVLYGPLTAYCEIELGDQGRVDIEGEYLPNVINCENGAAGFEALKAQAVAARSYLYYKLNEYGSIDDGQSDQVFTCGRSPGPQHYAAVEATSGEVLTYQDEVIAAFYVAGAIPSSPMCVGMVGDLDPYNTERYVTYNQGLSGDQVIQSTLGWVDPANLYNRGCKSQNGASCLAEAGIDYQNILRSYYGDDITLERSEGDCILLTMSEMNGGEESPSEEGPSEELSGGEESPSEESPSEESPSEESPSEESPSEESSSEESPSEESSSEESPSEEQAKLSSNLTEEGTMSCMGSKSHRRERGWEPMIYLVLCSIWILLRGCIVRSSRD